MAMSPSSTGAGRQHGPEGGHEPLLAEPAAAAQVELLPGRVGHRRFGPLSALRTATKDHTNPIQHEERWGRLTAPGPGP